jgi:hypothetical protein
MEGAGPGRLGPACAQGKISLSVDQIKTNNKVILTPP